jgi:signal transduction histidine kinase/ligand-binding sensor domain-containing protein
MKLLYLCLFLLAPVILAAQEYRSKDFRVEDGLPSNVIKAITQDSTGFFWIATDEGLVKFDGHVFTTYKSVLHSPYAKGFLHARDGRLYMYGDLDLIEITDELDTVIFKSLLRGTRNPTDSTISFPKAMYEDKDENLWLGEPQSVVLLRKGELSRFTFAIEDRSPHFLRSFNFFEDRAGFMYTVSFSGNVYLFDSDEYTFNKEPVSFPESVSDIKTIGNTIWITSSTGLYCSTLLRENGYSKPVKVADVPNASNITLLNDSSLLLSTWDTKHYFVDTKTNTLVPVPFRINTVNSSYQSTEGDLWLASIEGMVLLQKNDFYPVSTPDQVTFVEAITEDTIKHFVYHGTIENLYKVDSSPGSDLQSTTVLSIHDGYFQSLAFGSKGLWASSAFSLFLINNDKVTGKWTFDAAGRFVHDIFIDKKENIWLSQAGNNYVICLTSDLVEKRYSVPLKMESVVNCVREGSRGMYVASNGPEGYLFFKSPADSVFRNISIPVEFKAQGDFNVTDLAVTDSLVWLGTSEGLIRFNGSKLQRIDLGDLYSNVPVKAVKLLGSRYLVFNNSFGLFRYDIVTGEFWRYDEGNGLPSNTIKTRGVYVDNSGRVWVGTSLGLAVSNGPLTNDRATLSPRFVSTKVNGVEKRFTKGLDIPFGSFFTISVSCISFPSEKIQLQYRIASQDSTWKTLTGNQLTLSELPAGIYRIETRAKKNGGYVWSEINSLDFQVRKPFWQQTWFSASVLFLVSFIAWSSFALAAYINRKRRSQLEALVNQRTVELKRINDELSMRNSELDRFVYSTSHDLSAPLKSIRGLIMVAKMEETTNSQLSYLDMMEKSVKKLEAFIADVINYSRNTRAPVQHIPIDFGQFIKQVLDDHQYAPNYSKITFAIEDNLKAPLQSDEMRLRIIFNNLISNAIKFHFINDGIQPYVKITANEENEWFVFTVEDNGTGIHHDLKDRIFDMFFRATDSVQGSGLGLYILRESVHKLNGQVEVRSTLGAGTTFIITLPRVIKT